MLKCSYLIDGNVFMSQYSATDAVPVPGGRDLFQETLNSATEIFTAPSYLDQYASELSYLEILLALTFAALLGALIAYHPKRHVEASGPVSDKELKSTQILLCVAGAVMVALIQGSIERAFGLVGLGSFVRYRTTLRNPVDLSVILVLIGLGMACGLQYYEFAITVTGFMYVLLYMLEFSWGGRKIVWSLRVDTNEPIRVEKAFREVAAEHNLRIVNMRASAHGTSMRCRFVSRTMLNTEELTEAVRDRSGEGVHFARFDWEQESE